MARTGDPNAKIELLSAAEAVFVEVGLDRAKVEDITARAGRSKGSFYLHFESKEDAFRQLIETTLARLFRLIGEHRTVPMPVCPAELLERWLDDGAEIFEFIWQNRGLMRLVFEGGKSSHFFHLIDEFADRSRAEIVSALEHARARGQYRRDLDVEMASIVIAGAYDRFAREVVRAPRQPDVRSRLRALHDVILRGIGRPPVADHVPARFPDPSVNSEEHPTVHSPNLHPYGSNGALNAARPTGAVQRTRPTAARRLRARGPKR